MDIAAGYRVGMGYDVHVLEEGLPLWICGVQVPSALGARGHSDADVGLHALCDAILGALGQGDIGEHFPDNDPALAGIASSILLERVLALPMKDGLRCWKVVNADITVALQAPKLATLKPEMRHRVADLLGGSEHAVNIKATTTERLGFVGRSEGVAAWAVVLIQGVSGVE